MTRPQRAGLYAALAALTLLALLLPATLVLGVDPSAVPSALPSAVPSVGPSFGPAELLSGGDPRSEGEGPGLVGNPLLILLAVVVLGLVTAAITVTLLRLTARD